MKSNIENTFRPFSKAYSITKSNHVLQTPVLNRLMACGLFRREKELQMENREALSLPADEIDVIPRTHTHLDHCGYLPFLVRSSFWRKVYLMPPSKEPWPESRVPSRPEGYWYSKALWDWQAIAQKVKPR